MTLDFFPFLLALAIAAIAFVIWKINRKKMERAHLRFSSLTLLPEQGPTSNRVFAKLLRVFQMGAFVLLFLAFLDPRGLGSPELDPLTPQAKESYPKKGLVLYLVLDQSSSMAKEMGDASKMEVMKEVTRPFIEGRKSDFIGLVSFARNARIQSPLTLDYPFLLHKLSSLQVVKDPSVDGTAIGYAVYKTASLIAATKKWLKKGEDPYEMKGAAMILITDGFPYPHPEDRTDRIRAMELPLAAEFAKEQSVKLYIISIDPQIQKEEFAPHRRMMQRASEVTGGKFYMASSARVLENVWQEIDQLEASELPLAVEFVQEKERRWSLYPWLIGGAFGLLLMGFFIENRWMKRCP